MKPVVSHTFFVAEEGFEPFVLDLGNHILSVNSFSLEDATAFRWLLCGKDETGKDVQLKSAPLESGKAGAHFTFVDTPLCYIS